MSPWLPLEAIQTLHAAVVQAQLALPEHRGLLLSFLDRAFAATLPTLSDPYAQLLSDLQALNQARPLADGTVPLRQWLQIAITLTQARNEHQPFEQALALLRAQDTPSDPTSPKTPLSVVILAAHTEEGMQRISAQVRSLLEELRDQVSQVVVADLASEEAREHVGSSQLRVLLLGASTGGERGDALVRFLLGEPSKFLAACLHPLDPNRTRNFRTELPRRRALLEAIEAVVNITPFYLDDEAPALLKELIVRALGRVALTRVGMPAHDHHKLYDALCAIQNGTTYFDEILTFEFPQARPQVPIGGTPSQRAMQLLGWADTQPGAHDRIWQVVARKAPALLQKREPSLSEPPRTVEPATPPSATHTGNAVKTPSSDPKDSPTPKVEPSSPPTIGILTALSHECAAMRLMLENEKRRVVHGEGAGRDYYVGEIPAEGGGVHQIAVALLSDMGNNSAAIRATLLLQHFPQVRHIIMCGIAGGVPRPGEPEHDVRLGDIVVSNRNGVVQYDLIKEGSDGLKEHRHPPRPPGAELLGAVRHLLVEEEIGNRPWEAFLSRGAKMKNGVRSADNLDARGQPIDLPSDRERTPGMPRVFHATIAAANILLKNPKYRDYLGTTFGVKAVEMESSGVADATWTDSAGYLVVRGVCDYCDGNKGDLWQRAAAIAAAAYVRALIASMPAHTEVNSPNPR